MFFFFKQKTAYEMRISDWSSDVCSSDLDNRNDVVLLKSSDEPLPLPTYHLAHAVDDHLMRVTLVLRGDEWISSVPLHLQLFDALGFEPVRYAQIGRASCWERVCQYV